MYQSLIQTLSKLPSDIKVSYLSASFHLCMYGGTMSSIHDLEFSAQVWCGHEYTVKNLEFAAAAGNSAWCSAQSLVIM